MLVFLQSQLAAGETHLSMLDQGPSCQNEPIPESKKYEKDYNHKHSNDAAQSTNYPHHNYCNIGPVLGDVVASSKSHMPPPPPQRHASTVLGNYQIPESGVYAQVIDAFLIII